MFQTRLSTRAQATGALFVLLVVPLVLLWPVLFGGNTYVPWDLAQFPPVATTLTAEEQAAIHEQPAQNDVTEIPALVVPEIELARAERAEKRFPHWNPYARFGAPLFANSLAALVYPPNWALFVAADDPRSGLGWAAYLSFVIAGLLMFGFLREIELRPIAALFGAIAFAMGGTLLVNAHFYMRMNALIWLPGMLWACLRIAHAEGYRRVPSLIGLAACTAMTLLAGFPPYVAGAGLVTGIYACVLARREMRRSDAAAGLRLLALLGAGAVLGFGLAAVQLLPAFAYFPESNRTAVSTLAATMSQGFDPMGFLGLVLPDAFGHADNSPPTYKQSPLAYLLFSRPDLNNDGISFPHNYNYTEYTIFPGTLPLLLALIGVFTRTSRFRRPATWITVVLIVIAVAPLWASPLYRLPGLSTIPPMRFIGPVCVLFAALAAMGVEAIADGGAKRCTLIVCCVGYAGALVCGVLGLLSPLGDSEALLQALVERYSEQATLEVERVREYLGGDANLAAASERLDRNLLRGAIALALGSTLILLWQRMRSRPAVFRLIAITVVFLTAAELLAFGRPLNSGRTLDHAIDSEVHEFLREQRDRHAPDGGITIARGAPVAKEQVDLPAGTLFAERIRDLHAYAFVDRWSHRAFERMFRVQAADPATPIDDPPSTEHGLMVRGYWPMAIPDDGQLERSFYDLVGLRYVLSSDPLERAGTRAGPELEGPTGSRFFVYERPNPLSRAFVVHDLDIVDPLPDQDADDAVLERMIPDLSTDPEFDPRAAVVVTRDAADTLGQVVTAPGTRGITRTVQFRRDWPSDLVLDVAPGDPGYLVLSDSFMSGWKAAISGTPTPIVRGNLFMRVVRVPASGVEIRFTYHAPGFATGVTVTIVALLIALGLGLLYLYSRQVPATSDSA